MLVVQKKSQVLICLSFVDLNIFQMENIESDIYNAMMLTWKTYKARHLFAKLVKNEEYRQILQKEDVRAALARLITAGYVRRRHQYTDDDRFSVVRTTVMPGAPPEVVNIFNARRAADQRVQ